MGARIVTWVWFALAGTITAGGSSALEALRVLESALGPQALGSLVAMAGFDGDDQPQTWRLLIKNETAPDVLQEYVVTGGKVTGSNLIKRADYADLPDKPLLGLAAAWGVDSPEAYRIADDEAILAGISFARLHYQLRFRGADRAPTWLLTFADAAGAEVGQVVIDSATGAIAYRHFPPATPPAAPLAAGETPVPVPAADPLYSSKPVRLRHFFSGVRARREERMRD
jgi:hypothetical protein